MRPIFWGFVLIAFGILMLLDNLGYADFGDVIANFWPLLIIAWGLSILARRRTAESSSTQVVTQSAPASENAQAPQKVMDAGYTGDLIHQSNVFGDLRLEITSQNFKGGSLSVVFGDCYLDLRSAVIAQGDHELRLHSTIGSVRVLLPSNAPVTITANAFLGDVVVLGQKKDGFSANVGASGASYATSQNRLRIHANTILGEIRID